MRINDKNYTLNYGADKFFDQLLLRHRKNMFNKISRFVDIYSFELVLDIGSTSDTGLASNMFLHFFSEFNVVSISDQVIPAEVREKFPHVKFIKGDALRLDYPEKHFDLVFSNATLEHVGSISNQSTFIKEAVRVSKKSTIIIFPNRWFPIETHTKLPLIHFLPNRIHRKILKGIGYHELALEKNLNIPTKRQVVNLMKNLKLETFKIHKIKFLFFTSNLVIEISHSKSFVQNRKK